MQTGSPPILSLLASIVRSPGKMPKMPKIIIKMLGRFQIQPLAGDFSCGIPFKLWPLPGQAMQESATATGSNINSKFTAIKNMLTSREALSSQDNMQLWALFYAHFTFGLVRTLRCLTTAA